MALSSDQIESEYVRCVYSRLAAYSQATKPSSPRIWPKVRRFIDEQPAGSVILDVGCGEAKYTSDKCTIIGFDTCAEIIESSRKDNIELALADAMNIPIRDNSVDCILNVSVIHHLSTNHRRKQVVEECCRCLRPGGQMLIYTWAFEQPNGKFVSQDILVPWNLHETALAGRLPKIKFHMNSTKEQRVIESSIGIKVSDEEICDNEKTSQYSSISISTLFKKMSQFSRELMNWRSCEKTVDQFQLPAATPRFVSPRTAIISGIRKWSPLLGKRLTTILTTVEDQYADELSAEIMNESLTEVMAVLSEVKFYRYYHVFKEGELDELVSSVDRLKIVSSNFEHGNWCLIAEKLL